MCERVVGPRHSGPIRFYGEKAADDELRVDAAGEGAARVKGLIQELSSLREELLTL